LFVTPLYDVNPPPTYILLFPTTAIVYTPLILNPVELSNEVSFEPLVFNFIIRLLVTPLYVVKSPPTYNLPILSN